MVKKILSVFIPLLLLFSLSSCSPAEAVSNWISNLTDLLPNDVETVIGTKDNVDENHEMTLSEGYVNMFKNGSWHISYTLEDGRIASIGSNGIRYASTYDESLESPKGEIQIDENGNEIEPVIPQEHIVLNEEKYYWVDDNNSILYIVNPANYLAYPIEISAKNISLSEKGETDFNGKKCTYEKYKTDNGPITFYYSKLILCGITIEQNGTFTLKDIVAFDKYIGPEFFLLPDTYTIQDAWK